MQVLVRVGMVAFQSTVKNSNHSVVQMELMVGAAVMLFLLLMQMSQLF
jgi:hypothetical protein